MSTQGSGVRRMSHDVLDVFGSRTAVALFGTVTGILLARALGPHDRGILTLVLLLPSTLMTFTKFGITQANVYCVRREGAPVEHVAANSLVLALGLGFGLGAIAWFLRDTLLTTVMRGVPVWALALALWRLPLLLIDNNFNGVLQAVNNFSLYNRRTVAGAVLVLLLVVGLRIVHQLNLTSAVIVYSGVTTVVVGSLLVTTRRMIPFGMRPDRQLLDRQMRFGMKSYTQILAMHLLFRIDIYMVSYFLNPKQTAFYGLALHFTEMILEIPQAVGWVIYPRLASLDKDQVHRLTAQACRRTVLLTTVGGLAVVALGPFLVPLWYGHAFAPAVKPLPFAALGMVMMSVFTILTRDFTSRNNQTVNIRAGTVALVMNVGLNIFMIPAMGISGAALATTISYTTAALMVMIPYRRESGIALAEVLIPKREDVRFVRDAVWQAIWHRSRRALVAQPMLRPAASPHNGSGLGAVELVACTDPQEWDAVLAKRADATVFHQMGWLRLVASRRSATLMPYVVYHGADAVGVFPVFIYRRGLFRIAASPPPQAATPYLGPLIPGELMPAALRTFTQQMRRARVSYLEIRFAQQLDAALLGPDGFTTEPRATFMLDLQPGADQLWTGSLNSGCRRAVRKAIASGVAIEEGDLAAHLDRYYEMAVEVFAKSKRPPSLSKDDYAALAALARNGGPVKVFFARHQGRLIAGGIFPYDANTIYYLDGASDPSGQEVRPNNLLHWEVIRWACAHGLARYDMVGAGVESIARFKRGFGPVEAPYTYAFRSLDFVTRAARSTYAFLAPAGRAVQHAAQRITMRGQAKVAAEAVSND